MSQHDVSLGSTRIPFIIMFNTSQKPLNCVKMNIPQQFMTETQVFYDNEVVQIKLIDMVEFCD